jgi:hypothetical protein
MTDLGGLPTTELRFDKKGRRLGKGPVAPAGVTDLIVISHGWHQDGRDAQNMYAALLTNVKAVASAHSATAARTFGVAAIYWPSDKFKDDLSLEELPPSIGPAVGVATRDLSAVDLRKRASDTAKLLRLPRKAFADLAVRAANGGTDVDDLVTLLREAITPTATTDLTEEHSVLLGSRSGQAILNDLRTDAATAAQQAPHPVAGAEAKPAVNLLTGAKALIARLLNQAAYYELKARAGTVGEGLAKAIDADGLPGVQRLHFVGHSFGARLVTSATASLNTLRPYSLTLLQAAFSHNSFGVEIGPRRIKGGFRNVVEDGRVTGHIAVSHTWNDRAVGVAYAIASVAGGHIASALQTNDTFGGPNDIHGGLGANGALRLKRGEGDAGTFDGLGVPALKQGKINSRRCDFIPDHGGITAVETARLVVAAMS